MLPVELECPRCGGVAMVVRVAAAVDGRAGRCRSCGHPGCVVVDDVDDPSSDVSWADDDGNCEVCDACLEDLGAKGG